MNDILLPKGIRRLKDKSGNNVDYDIPLPVFSPGYEAGILEQLTLSLNFRGGDAVIDRPYVVRLVEQPLSKLFINQLCLWNVCDVKIDSWEGLAQYVASEHMLVAPNILTGKALELQNRFETLKKRLNADNSKAPSKAVSEISDMLESTITPCTRFRDPRVISILHDFQKEYKKPDNPHLAVILDMYRRIVDKSLQETQNSSVTTISKLVEQFENNPTVRNARLVDVFARQHNALGFNEDKELMYGKAINVYRTCVSSKFNIEDMVSSYASLIIFEKLLGLNEEATKHVHELKSLDIPKNKSRLNSLRNLFLSKGEVKLTNGNISKLGIVGLENYYNPDILWTVYCRLKDYEKNDGKKARASYPIDLMESLVEHAKATKLHDAFYEKNSKGEVIRILVFNQNPYVKLHNQISSESIDNVFVIKQKVPENYFGLAEKLLNPLRKYMKHGKIAGEPDAAKLLSTDVDRYLFAVPDIRQALYAPGSSMTATLPTKPKLLRYGPNGDGAIETERYRRLQES
jgi:hypothetical protein